MARICIVTPARAGSRNGNRHTAGRWAGFLRGFGHRVAIRTQWQGEPCDLLLALHARRSHASILEFHTRFPGKPLVVVLTGTDLYSDLPKSREARESLRLAERIVVLQSEARLELEKRLRAKTRVLYQSSRPTVRHCPPAARFRIAVVGHLREVKDPFRAVAALSCLKKNSCEIELIQIGDALSAAMKSAANQWMNREPRYRWLGGRTHAQSLGWISRSHLLVVSSEMEGGANVIAEAARIGTPVLASRVSGNVGMLGRSYPGYFPLFDERILARLLRKAVNDNAFYKKLKSALRSRRPIFAPAAERRALASILGEFDARL